MAVAADPELDRDEAFARIRLLRSPNVGAVSYAQLLRRFGSAASAIEALPDLSGRGGRTYTPAALESIEREVAAIRRCGARYLFHDQPEYPPLLRHCEGAPPILIVRGNGALARRPCVAIVGARNASAGAIRLARSFAADLACAGVVVVSGLARGIDCAAHQGALTAAETAGVDGGTIAVIASGIDIVYPPEHALLQDQIAETGLLIAEQPPGTEPLARHFPTRNRIIAGLAQGTLVVEAAPRSGSLITARLAGEFSRDVMAVPGSPLDPRSLGCNQLIRDGATLVQSAGDVLEMLGHGSGSERRLLFSSDPGSEAHIALSDHPAADVASLLSFAPVSVDELVRQSGESSGAVQLALLELELAGRLLRHAGCRVSLMT